MDLERLREVKRDATYFMGGGIDSNVYVIPPLPGGKDWVAKFYKSEVSERQFRYYFDITNQAARIAITERWTWQFNRPYGLLAVQIVPFAEVIIDNNQIIAVSKRIKAKRCDCVNDGNDFDEPFKLLGRFIESRLGVRGIELCSLNSRIDSKTKTMFITDLCSELRGLDNR